MKRLLIAIVPVLPLLACIASTPTATEGPAVAIKTATPTQTHTPETVSVWVYFTMTADENMTPVPASRTVPETDSREELLQSTLKELLTGPTDAEKDAGFVSWFSPATTDAVIDVVWDGDFFTVVFQGLNTLIPNASASAGSQMLLSQLDSTMFQFDFVQRVNYTLEGNCDDFWEWLQMGCHIVTRAEWEAG
jgi:spore germination protein GerM